MLKTECTECKVWVYSPFLTDMKETVCPDCGVTFQVGEIFISAGPYAIYRDVLLKNMHKYTRLLAEARKELSELDRLKGLSNDSKAYGETTETIKKFIKNLEELLEGCRGGLRVPVEDITLDYVFDKNLYNGKLVNISTTGVCLEVGENVSIHSKGQEINLSIKEENMSEPLHLAGEIVWAGRGGRVGVKFLNMDEDKKHALREFIMDKNERLA